MTKVRNLRRNEQGAGAVEFAIVAPALLGFVIGLTQLGMLFFANADLHNAVAAGARLAMVYPRPADSAVTTRITSLLTRLDQSKLTTPTITHGTDASGHDYEDIAVTYQVPLNFIIYKPPAVTLRENRRVYVESLNQVAPTTNPSSTTSTTSTTSATSATSSGTTTSTGSTTSATSASTTGGWGTTSTSTSSGTTTSTSSGTTTSTSSGTTTSTSSSGASSASSASSAGGHAHGNCKRSSVC
jgi:Flp pilus assembly protein TadG